jgi:hypothetical protein
MLKTMFCEDIQKVTERVRELKGAVALGENKSLESIENS